MLRLLAALLVCSSALAQAEDLGRVGKVFPIVERDLIEVFKERAQARMADGSWQKLMDKQRDKMKAYAERPIGKRLPRALEYSSRYYDPSIVLEQDISDADGKILYSKGTRVNPLDYRGYTKTLCFFDGDDKAQVKWAEQYCLDPIKAKAILTNGPVMKLANEYKTPIYFDQYGFLQSHFRLKAVPSVIRQTGKVFSIEEFPVGP